MASKLDTSELTRRGPEVATQLRESIERVLLAGGDPVNRLGSACTSVTFSVVDAPELSVTLLMDRQPPEAADGSEPAEITIELLTVQAQSFARGELPLPTCILHGDIGFSGPVRKYLSFDPILRALLARANQAEA